MPRRLFLFQTSREEQAHSSPDNPSDLVRQSPLLRRRQVNSQRGSREAP